MKAVALTALLASTALADTSVGAPVRASCLAAPTLSRAIRCKGNTCRVDRAAVDCWLEHSSELAAQARIVPHFVDGNANGFRLFSVQPSSLYAHLRLRNGDILQRINGLDITSPEHALEAYARLRDTTQISLDILRNGQRSTLEYMIR